MIIRFIVGEIVAAVNFLHESGFCYGDLKPENVLITELGHIKVKCITSSFSQSTLLMSPEGTISPEICLLILRSLTLAVADPSRRKLQGS